MDFSELAIMFKNFMHLYSKSLSFMMVGTRLQVKYFTMPSFIMNFDDCSLFFDMRWHICSANYGSIVIFTPIISTISFYSYFFRFFKVLKKRMKIMDPIENS